MSNKKVLSIVDVQEQAKRKEFNAALNAAAKMMPEGCGIIFIQSDAPATYQLGGMALSHVVGSLEIIKNEILSSPEGNVQ